MTGLGLLETIGRALSSHGQRATTDCVGGVEIVDKSLVGCDRGLSIGLAKLSGCKEVSARWVESLEILVDT